MLFRVVFFVDFGCFIVFVILGWWFVFYCLLRSLFVSVCPRVCLVFGLMVLLVFDDCLLLFTCLLVRWVGLLLCDLFVGLGCYCLALVL